MNQIDMFLLIDLILIVSLEDGTKHEPSWIHMAITYCAVIIPLLYITISTLYMIGRRCVIILKRCYSLVPNNKLSSYPRDDDIDLSIQIVSRNRYNNTTTVSFSEHNDIEEEFSRSPTETCLEREPLLFSIEREK